MIQNYRSAEPVIRERRLGSTTCYEGTVADLEQRGCNGCGDGQKRCYSTATYCSHIIAVNNLAVIRNVVIVDHGPLGCSSGMMKWNANYKLSCKRRGEKYNNLHVISTNLTESDTIFGAVEKLRDAVKFAYERYKPDVIFITASCAASVIGEDFESVIPELSETIPIPIGFCGCAGVRSKLWATGFDAEQHATFKTLVKPPREKRHNVVNFIDFLGAPKAFINDVLGRLGLRVQFLNSFATVEDFTHISESLATTSICRTLPSYLGGALEREYGVPFLKEDFAIGISGFERWYRAIAKLAGKEKEAEDYIKEQRAIYLPLIESHKTKFAGKKAMVSMGPGFAFELVRLCNEIGLEVVHANSFHYDPVLDSADEKAVAALNASGINVDISVEDAQHYATIKRLKHYKPDIVITRVHGAQNPALRLGIPFINLASVDTFGYAATLASVGLLADEMENTNLQRKIAARTDFHLSEKFNILNKNSFVSEVGI